MRVTLVKGKIRGTHYPSTHGIKSLTIPAIAYFINSLDGQTSGRERGEPVFL